MRSQLTVQEVGIQQNVSSSTVRRWLKSGLEHYKIGNTIRIKATDLEKFISHFKRRYALTEKLLINALTIQPPSDNHKAKGGKGKLAKKKPACFNYGFGRIYVRTYKSGRRSWTISYYNEDGKRIQKATPQAQTKEEAAAVLQREVLEVHDRRHGIERRRRKIGFATFSEIYLQDYAMITKKSWRTDANRLRTMNEFFKDAELRQITPLMIQKFRAWRLREGNAKSTTNRFLTHLKRIFNIAIEEGYLEHNPAKKIKLFSERDNLKERILTPAEEKKLLEESTDYLKPIIITALNTGMRKAEILNLQWNQVDLKARRIRVEKTKSGKVRFIPINDLLFHELNTLRVVSDKSSFVFFNPETMRPYVDLKKGFKTACRRAKIEGMRFHDLRHTFASRLIEFGADIGVVKELLGHSSLTITERYVHSTDDRKRAAVELLSGSAGEEVCDVAVTQEKPSKLIH